MRQNVHAGSYAVLTAKLDGPRFSSSTALTPALPSRILRVTLPRVERFEHTTSVVIAPVGDATLFPEVTRVLSVSARCPWHREPHDTAARRAGHGTASTSQKRPCSRAIADVAPLQRLQGSSVPPSLPSEPASDGGTLLQSPRSRGESRRPDTCRRAQRRHMCSDHARTAPPGPAASPAGDAPAHDVGGVQPPGGNAHAAGPPAASSPRSQPPVVPSGGRRWPRSSATLSVPGLVRRL